MLHSRRLNIKHSCCQRKWCCLVLKCLKTGGCWLALAGWRETTRAHNGVFSVWPRLSTLYFLLFIRPLVCCSIFLPAASPHLSSVPIFSPPVSCVFIFLRSISILFTFTHTSKTSLCAHPAILPSIPPLIFNVGDWQAVLYTLEVDTKLPCGWVRGLRGLMSPGCARVSVHQQRGSAQWRELRLEQVPAVLPRVC